MRARLNRDQATNKEEEEINNFVISWICFCRFPRKTIMMAAFALSPPRLLALLLCWATASMILVDSRPVLLSPPLKDQSLIALADLDAENIVFEATVACGVLGMIFNGGVTEVESFAHVEATIDTLNLTSQHRPGLVWKGPFLLFLEAKDKNDTLVFSSLQCDGE